MGFVILFYLTGAVIEGFNNVYITICDIASDDNYDTDSMRVTWQDVVRMIFLTILWPGSIAYKVVDVIRAAEKIDDRRYQAEVHEQRRRNKQKNKSRARKQAIVNQYGDVVDENDSDGDEDGDNGD